MSETEEVFVPRRFATKAPFPWYGGKSDAAPLIWQRLGDVDHYAEPFAGTLAVLLNRPHPCNWPYHSETVNDADGFIVNVWRALQQSPEETAKAASYPITEADKTARQIALLKWRDEAMLDKLAGDPKWHDPEMAGWWLYSVACHIGAFSGDGPWTADPVTGRIYKQEGNEKIAGVARNRPYIGHNGQGTNHANIRESGVSRGRIELVHNGRGLNNQTFREPGVLRNRSETTTNGRGTQHSSMREPGTNYHDLTMPKLLTWFGLLSARLRHVRILNGDWSRLCTKGALQMLNVRFSEGHAGIFLDPPYSDEVRSKGLYSLAQDKDITTAVRDWCIKNGGNEKYRIALAGFDTEHDILCNHGWKAEEWFKEGLLKGGMGKQQHRERLWFSPHCLYDADMSHWKL